MAHYYLSVRYRDHLFRDEEGEDMPSGIEMKVRALETARDLSGHRFSRSPTGSTAPWRSRTRAGRRSCAFPFPMRWMREEPEVSA